MSDALTLFDEADRPTIVAASASRHGGTCDHCGAWIKAGEPIFKIAGTGSTTAYGNGPGSWWCVRCAGQITD